MANWGWWTFNNRNGLVGAESSYEFLPDGRRVLVKDPNNPAVLEDTFIANALRTSRQARRDFCRLFPDLDQESQERLTNLILQNPRATSLMRDDQNFMDAIQNKNVTDDIRVRLTKITRTSQNTSKELIRSRGGSF